MSRSVVSQLACVQSEFLMRHTDVSGIPPPLTFTESKRA
jgi:hypothetical protein